MDARICAQSMCPSFHSVHRRMLIKSRRPSVVAVLTRPVYDIADGEPKNRSVYKDNWFDLLAINHLSKNLQAAAGLENKKSGYESLVDAAFAVSQRFDPMGQRQIVTKTLEAAFPRSILSLIKTLLPQSKFAREYFATFTTLFFAWLVGPCEVRESELNGRRERNVVHIKKCRFLEETNCAGVCTNMCKMPSQSFIKNNLGVPVNMVPNFDDMSCEMVFGQDPPELDDDPAFKQPCNKKCRGNRKHSFKCPS